MNSRDDTDTVPVGRVVGVHGIRGELKLVPYSGEYDFPWRVVFVTFKGQKRTCTVSSTRTHKKVILVKLDGIDTRTDAESLVGAELSILKKDLPELPEGEYYYHDLEGMGVWTEDGEYLGRIIHILSTGSNDVYEITGPRGEILIPAIKDVVVEVDVERKRMTVRLLEGLLPEDK